MRQCSFILYKTTKHPQPQAKEIRIQFEVQDPGPYVRPQFTAKDLDFPEDLPRGPENWPGRPPASSQAATAARPAHHSRSPSYLRPSDHHLHLTPPSILRSSIQAQLGNGVGEAERCGGVHCGVDLPPRQRDDDRTEDAIAPRESRAREQGAGLIWDCTIILDEGQTQTERGLTFGQG